jgi:hypothetical protein
MKITIRKTLNSYDSDDIICGNNRFIGFKSKIDGCIGLINCPLCGRENYAPAVLSGICTWCGFDLKQKMKEDGDER